MKNKKYISAVTLILLLFITVFCLPFKAIFSKAEETEINIYYDGNKFYKDIAMSEMLYDSNGIAIDNGGQIKKCVNGIRPLIEDVSYTTTAKSTFEFIWANEPSEGEKLTIEDGVNLSYQKKQAAGVISRYDGKKLTIVIEENNGELNFAGTEISDGINYYKLNEKGQVIIPFGSINENGKIKLKFIDNIQLGTYRILLRVWNGGEEKLTIPYNFIIKE